MPTHDSSADSEVEASIAFTKQLALSFIALVLMLFIVVSERNRHTPQYTSAAGVKGITDEQKMKAKGTNTVSTSLMDRPLLTCAICRQKFGKRTLCMEPGQKRSYCSDSCPAGSIGGTTGVCGEKPTEKPKPSWYPTNIPRPTIWPTVVVKPSYTPPVTCPPVRIQNPPPQGCTYVWPSCYGPECSQCPQPKLICTQSTTPTVPQ